MNKINLITPPDVLHNQAIDIMLIRPNETVRNHIHNILENIDEAFNIYLYDPQTEEEQDLAWMLSVARISKYVILNVDNLIGVERNFSSYIISLPSTYYLTNDEITPYNKISVNKIYNLEWLYKILKKED